ncbi:hypothetical protein [Streptomyces sp. NPDC001100]
MASPDKGPAEPARHPEGAQLSATITLLTTQHYNLQTQRAATIGEANGRASIFLGAVSAGLIAIGFQGPTAGRSTGIVTFEVLVLSCLCFLGIATFMRCVEIAIDDWQFFVRINALRTQYAILAPDTAELLQSSAETEQSAAMLSPRRRVMQMMLTVAGSIGIVTGFVAGADAGVLAYGFHATFVQAVLIGAAIGLSVIVACDRFQRARWRGALPTQVLTRK